MNNCPKCGNPLQPGQTICPICGTNISIAPITPVAQAAVQQPTKIEQPVAPIAPVENIQPVTVTKPVAPVAPAAPVTQPVAPAVPVAPVQPVKVSEQTPVAPVEQTVPTVQPVEQPVQPVVEETPVAPVAEPIKEQVPTKVESMVEQQAVAPAVEQPEPVPSVAPVTTIAPSNVIDAMSLPNLEQLEAKIDQANVTKEIKKTKFKMTKPMMIGCIAAVLIILGSAIAINLKSSQTVTTNPNAIQNPEISKNKVNSNGFKFDIINTWFVVENGKDVIVYNDSETVTVKLFSLKSSYDTLSATQIEEYFETSEYYKNIKVESVTLSSEKKAVKVTADYSKDDSSSIIEYYYISATDNETVGMTVIYKDEQSKTDNSTAINELAGSISYSDDSIKTLNIKTANSYIFSAGEKIFNDYYYGIEDLEESKDIELEDDTTTDDTDNSIDYSEEYDNTYTE